jgi:hypothetical protein
VTKRHLLIQHVKLHDGIPLFNPKKKKLSSLGGSQTLSNSLPSSDPVGAPPPSKIRRIVIKTPKLTCLECPFTTQSQEVLQLHVQYHGDNLDLPYVCDKCTFRCASQDSLHAHAAVHERAASDLAERVVKPIKLLPSVPAQPRVKRKYRPPVPNR